MKNNQSNERIMKVDEEFYYLGKPASNFWSSDKNLKFYDFRCNWTSNK